MGAAGIAWSARSKVAAGACMGRRTESPSHTGCRLMPQLVPMRSCGLQNTVISILSLEAGENGQAARAPLISAG